MGEKLRRKPETSIEPAQLSEILKVYDLALHATEIWNNGIWTDREKTYILLNPIIYDILKVIDGITPNNY